MPVPAGFAQHVSGYWFRLSDQAGPFLFDGTTMQIAGNFNSVGQSILSLGIGDNAALNARRTHGIYLENNITTAATTTIKSGAGLLGKIVVNKAIALGVITIYDSLSGSGTKLGTITYGAALLSDPPLTGHYEGQFAIGLTIVTSLAMDITVCYV